MTGLAVLLLLMILARGGGAAASSAKQALPERAAQAHVDAVKAQRQAQRTGNPADIARAHQAARNAATAKQAANAATRAAKTPHPWPQAAPRGLPPFPGGWQPDEPPAQPVVTRAWQLLPVLWGKGAGTKKVELTSGRWITYVAAPVAQGKRGVVAYRVRSEFLPGDAAATAPSSLAV
jgi:hypothetical protein